MLFAMAVGPFLALAHFIPMHLFLPVFLFPFQLFLPFPSSIHPTSILTTYTHLPTYLRTYLPTYLPTHLPSYAPTHLPSYAPTHLPMCISICFLLTFSIYPQTLRDRLGVRCVLGLTATATHATGLSVAEQLGVATENIVWGAALPHNLNISVSCDEDRDQVSCM